jgi:hypothetical protein
MAISPQYIGTAKSPSVTISTANTNRDGTTGAYGTLMTAGSTGSRVDMIRVNATGTTTAGMIRFFLGTALIREVPVVAITPSATNPAFFADVWFDTPLVLEAASVLKCSTNNAETFAVTITNGGDF